MLLVAAVVLAVYWLPPGWGAAAIAAASALELAELGFWVWLSRRRRPVVGVEALAGRVAVVVTKCDPEGEVRVDGELWRARSETPAFAGDRVVIDCVGAELTLFVRPVRAEA